MPNKGVHPSGGSGRNQNARSLGRRRVTPTVRPLHVMSLSKPAYELGSVVICGGETVHDFANSIVCDGLTAPERERFLRESFTELVAGGFVMWTLERDYGNEPAMKPSAASVESFLADWRLCFPAGIILRGVIPNARNWTLFIGPTDSLAEALDEYDTTAA